MRGVTTADARPHATLRQWAAKIENTFLVMGLIFGLLVVFITPPFQVPDEASHFFRAYQISQGDLLPEKRGQITGGILPASLQELPAGFELGDWRDPVQTTFSHTIDARRIQLEPQNVAFAGFSNTTAYGRPLVYAPQVAGILVGRLLSSSALDLLYFARLGGLLVWLLLSYWAIRIIPGGKWALLAMSFTPMLLFLAASTSADSFVLGLTALTVAITVRFASTPDRLTPRQLALIFVVAVVLAATKMPYSLGFLVFLAIPAAKYGGLKTYAAFWAVTTLLCVGSMGVWLLAAQTFYSPARLDEPISPYLQLAFLAQNPLVFVRAVFDVYVLHGLQVLWGFVGVLGQSDTSLPYWLRILAVINVTIGMLTVEPICRHLKAVYKWVAALVPLGILLAIHLLQYLSWTPVGRTDLEGLFGRYLLAVAILSIPLLATRKNLMVPVKGWRSAAALTLLQVVLASSTIVVLLSRYY
jgi:uncharacterized membrane protein